MTRCTRPTICVAGQVPRSMEPELIVGAAVLRGAAWADQRACQGPVMADSRWPVVMTAGLPSREIAVAAGADRLYCSLAWATCSTPQRCTTRIICTFCRA